MSNSTYGILLYIAVLLMVAYYIAGNFGEH